jgi:F-type H+-transporting ATPase subunit b
MTRYAASISTAGLLLLPAAALAQESTEHEGMPQLNFASPLTVSQIVWMALIFLALYLLLARWALPQVEVVLEDRAARINGDLDAARAAKSEVDAAMQEVRLATRQAQAEAQAQISAAVAEAKAAAAAQSEQANTRLEEQLSRAENQIEAARSAAMGALRQVASVTTANLVDRLTGTAAQSGRVDEMVGAVLAARRT